MIDLITDFDIPFTKEILKMYEIYTYEKFVENPIVLNGFEDNVKLLYDRHNAMLMKINSYEKNFNYCDFDNKKNIMIGFSGGLDSAYSALKMRDDGYEVTLFHISNLNKHFPKEDIHAINFAKLNNFKLINITCVHKSKEYFIDNPLKNQVILSCMTEIGNKIGINNLMLGSDTTSNISESTIGMTITDSKENYQTFNKGLKLYYPNTVLHFIDSNIPKFDRIKYIMENHIESLDLIYSCISPHRFNKKLHNDNNNKYNIALLTDRCGSCYKCCMEYILLYELGYYSNDVFLQHCYEILSKTKNSHKPNLFNLKLPYEIRRKNVLEYMS